MKKWGNNHNRRRCREVLNSFASNGDSRVVILKGDGKEAETPADVDMAKKDRGRIEKGPAVRLGLRFARGW